MALSAYSPLPNTNDSVKKCIEIPIQHFPAQSLQRIGAKLQRRGATKSATKSIKSKVPIPPMPPMASVSNCSPIDGEGFGCGCSAVSASKGASSSSIIDDSNTSSSSPSTGAPYSAALSDDASAASTGFDDNDDEQRPSTSPTAIGDDAAVALCATERMRSLFIPLALLDDAEADSAGNAFEQKFGGRFCCCLSAKIERFQESLVDENRSIH